MSTNNHKAKIAQPVWDEAALLRFKNTINGASDNDIDIGSQY